MNIDYENFYNYVPLPVTPDVLVAPSELRYFVKVRGAGMLKGAKENRTLIRR